MNIISGCKKLCRSIYSGFEIFCGNMLLLGQLVLLVLVATGGGIMILPLLSFFDKGVREWPWYVKHFTLLTGFIGCEIGVVYLIFHIIILKTGSGIKRVKAEEKVRRNEDDYFPFPKNEPIFTKLLRISKPKNLHLPWKKDE